MVWVCGVKHGGGEVNCVCVCVRRPRAELDQSVLTPAPLRFGLPVEFSKVYASTYAVPIYPNTASHTLSAPSPPPSPAL